MLYHVPDLDRTLAEIERVLVPGGQFYAATNGEGHMHEVFDLEEILLREVGQKEGAPSPRSFGQSFTLENGADPIRRHFEPVTLLRYPDGLRVTKPSPDRLHPFHAGRFQTAPPPGAVEAFTRRIEEQIQAQGAIPSPKTAGSSWRSQGDKYKGLSDVRFGQPLFFQQDRLEMCCPRLKENGPFRQLPAR